LDAFTVYPLPRKRPTLRALAGDSTITSFPPAPVVLGEGEVVCLTARRVFIVRFFDVARALRLAGFGICLLIR
jgi:hypothetical protein